MPHGKSGEKIARLLAVDFSQSSNIVCHNLIIAARNSHNSRQNCTS